MFKVNIAIDPIMNILILVKNFIFLVVKISIVSRRYAVAAVHAGMKVKECELKVIVDSVKIGFVKSFSV